MLTLLLIIFCIMFSFLTWIVLQVRFASRVGYYCAQFLAIICYTTISTVFTNRLITLWIPIIMVIIAVISIIIDRFAISYAKSHPELEPTK